MSRGRWDEMMSYPKDLAAAVKGAREGIAKRESMAKAKQYEREASEGLKRRAQEKPKAQTSAPSKKEDISVGSTIEKIKARQKMMSEI